MALLCTGGFSGPGSPDAVILLLPDLLDTRVWGQGLQQALGLPKEQAIPGCQ
jgi:hypothetical protein